MTVLDSGVITTSSLVSKSRHQIKWELCKSTMIWLYKDQITEHQFFKVCYFWTCLSTCIITLVFFTAFLVHEFGSSFLLAALHSCLVLLLFRSEIAWRDAKYAQIHEYLREEYEVTQRFGNLDFKLKFVEVCLSLCPYNIYVSFGLPGNLVCYLFRKKNSA